jgi:hypothetical protein
MYYRSRLALALGLAAGGTYAGTSAHAYAEDCSKLPNPVFVAGSTAAKLFVGAIAAELQKQDPPVTIVFAPSPSGSCAGVGLFTGDSPGKLTGTGRTYDADGKEVADSCDLKDDVVDLALSDVWPSTCDGSPKLPANVKEFHGPIQTMTFVVPAQSSQNNISAEAAYLVFGFGDDSEVAPWNDATSIFVRSSQSGTQQMIGRSIKVPAGKFKGVASASGGDVLKGITAMAAAGNADKTIGILGADAINATSRPMLKILGYQHYGQDCAYWPDTDANSFDKINVRDGHYPIWGPLHLIASVENGEIADPNTKQVVDYLSGAKTPTGFDLIELEAKNNVVPACAMHVSRTEDGGALMSHQPEKDCTCKFLTAATGQAPSDCKACETDADCSDSASKCNYKFCEVK